MPNPPSGVPQPHRAPQPPPPHPADSQDAAGHPHGGFMGGLPGHAAHLPMSASSKQLPDDQDWARTLLQNPDAKPALQFLPDRAGSSGGWIALPAPEYPVISAPCLEAYSPLRKGQAQPTRAPSDKRNHWVENNVASGLSHTATGLLLPVQPPSASRSQVPNSARSAPSDGAQLHDGAAITMATVPSGIILLPDHLQASSADGPSAQVPQAASSGAVRQEVLSASSPLVYAPQHAAYNQPQSLQRLTAIAEMSFPPSPAGQQPHIEMSFAGPLAQQAPSRLQPVGAAQPPFPPENYPDGYAGPQAKQATSQLHPGNVQASTQTLPAAGSCPPKAESLGERRSASDASPLPRAMILPSSRASDTGPMALRPPSRASDAGSHGSHGSETSQRPTHRPPTGSTLDGFSPLSSSMNFSQGFSKGALDAPTERIYQEPLGEQQQTVTLRGDPQAHHSNRGTAALAVDTAAAMTTSRAGHHRRTSSISKYSPLQMSIMQLPSLGEQHGAEATHLAATTATQQPHQSQIGNAEATGRISQLAANGTMPGIVPRSEGPSPASSNGADSMARIQGSGSLQGDGHSLAEATGSKVLMGDNHKAPQKDPPPSSARGSQPDGNGPADSQSRGHHGPQPSYTYSPLMAQAPTEPLLVPPNKLVPVPEASEVPFGEHTIATAASVSQSAASGRDSADHLGQILTSAALPSRHAPQPSMTYAPLGKARHERTPSWTHSPLETQASSSPVSSSTGEINLRTAQGIHSQHQGPLTHQMATFPSTDASLAREAPASADSSPYGAEHAKSWVNSPAAMIHVTATTATSGQRHQPEPERMIRHSHAPSSVYGPLGKAVRSSQILAEGSPRLHFDAAILGSLEDPLPRRQPPSQPEPGLPAPMEPHIPLKSSDGSVALAASKHGAYAIIPGTKSGGDEPYQAGGSDAKHAQRQSGQVAQMQQSQGAIQPAGASSGAATAPPEAWQVTQEHWRHGSVMSNAMLSPLQLGAAQHSASQSLQPGQAAPFDFGGCSR